MTSQAARELGVSIKTANKWLKRFHEQGVDGLRDRSSRPHRSPATADEVLRTAAVTLRRQRLTLVAIAGQPGLSRATAARIAKAVSKASLSFIFFATLACWVLPQGAYAENSDHDAWKNFSVAQKRYALFGFIDCHRLVYPHATASMYNADEEVYGELDRLAAHSDGTPMGKLILDAMRKMPAAAPDRHAEHGSVDDGILWRGLNEREKEAYVQGVYWCAETAPATTVNLHEKCASAAVKALDAWYVVSDDEWKDPRSNARVDIPVVSAMQQAGIVSIRPAKKP